MSKKVLLTRFFRLPTTNGDLIITKSHGPHHMSSGLSNAGPSRSSQSSPQSGHHNLSNYHLPSSMNKSPTNSSSHKPPLSPAGSDNSGGDLLSDSPSKYKTYLFKLVKSCNVRQKSTFSITPHSPLTPKNTKFYFTPLNIFPHTTLTTFRKNMFNTSQNFFYSVFTFPQHTHLTKWCRRRLYYYYRYLIHFHSL